MKELSIEQKARAYDKVREKIAIRFGSNVADEIFSQFEMSEGERIRKAILELVRQSSEILEKKNQERMINWLEKQGEQKPADKVEPKFKVGDWVVVDDGRTGRIIERTKDFADVDLEFSCLSTRVNNIRSWTIQDAKDGDVLNSMRVQATIIFKGFADDGKHILAYCALQKGIFIKQEMLWDRDFEPCPKNWNNELFSKMHEAGYEWDADKKQLKKISDKSLTIEPNFKEGDVIREKETGNVFLVNSVEDFGYTLHYKNCTAKGCTMSFKDEDKYELVEQKPADEVEPKFKAGDKVISTISNIPYYITKVCNEHYLTDVGCIIMFNAQDNFELVEQNTAWSEEDEEMIGYIGNAITTNDATQYLNEKGICTIDANVWFEKLKGRVQPQPKQEWSEEDESRMDNLCHFLEEYGNQYYGHLTLQCTISWLKSLRPQK